MEDRAKKDSGGNHLQRVKVYRLSDESKWDDKGTGHVSVEYLERANAVGLVVIDEEDNRTLLVHRISADDIYQRQEETIISWTDPEVATDLALSFQEGAGCAYIWDQICDVQRQIQFPGPGRPGSDGFEVDRSAGSDEAFGMHTSSTSDFPAVELSNLQQISRIISEVSPFHRDRLASVILQNGYVPKLQVLFRECEDLENTEGLHHLYTIFRGLILLNEGQIFEILLSEASMMDTLGALEYDPELPEKQEHRKFVKEKVKFKEAVPISNPDILSKIHQTYHIGYLKDVVLPRVLDDCTFGTLNSLMLFNNVEVVTSLQQDKEFVNNLFSLLRSKDPDEDSWKDMVRFLQEFCSLHKHLQPPQRNLSFSALIDMGLFDVVTKVMQQYEDEGLCTCGADILMSSMSPDPSSLRNFLVKQPLHTLFSSLVRGMVASNWAGGLQTQLLEILRLLLDSDTMEAAEKSKFLDVFYEEYIDKLISALVASCPSKSAAAASKNASKTETVTDGAAAANGVKAAGSQSVPAETLLLICDILCFCVQHHGFRIKYFILRNNIVEKVLRLTRRPEKYLVVAAVRFLRTCVGLKDEFYFRYLVKNNLFEPVVTAFVANGNAYNLLNSAILEMFEFIRKENLKSLITHVMESFAPSFEGVDYVDTFQLLRVKYDQIMDQANEQSKLGPMVGPPPPPGLQSSSNSGGVVGKTRLTGKAGTQAGGESDEEGDRMNSASGSLAKGEGPYANGPSIQRRRKDERDLEREEEKYFEEEEDDEEEDESGIVCDGRGDKAQKQPHLTSVDPSRSLSPPLHPLSASPSPSPPRPTTSASPPRFPSSRSPSPPNSPRPLSPLQIAPPVVASRQRASGGSLKSGGHKTLSLSPSAAAAMAAAAAAGGAGEGRAAAGGAAPRGNKHSLPDSPRPRAGLVDYEDEDEEDEVEPTILLNKHGRNPAPENGSPADAQAGTQQQKETTREEGQHQEQQAMVVEGEGGDEKGKAGQFGTGARVCEEACLPSGERNAASGKHRVEAVQSEEKQGKRQRVADTMTDEQQQAPPSKETLGKQKDSPGSLHAINPLEQTAVERECAVSSGGALPGGEGVFSNSRTERQMSEEEGDAHQRTSSGSGAAAGGDVSHGREHQGSSLNPGSGSLGHENKNIGSSKGSSGGSPSRGIEPDAAATERAAGNSIEEPGARQTGDVAERGNAAGSCVEVDDKWQGSRSQESKGSGADNEQPNRVGGSAEIDGICRADGEDTNTADEKHKGPDSVVPQKEPFEVR